jgi:hypothetical protein
MRRPRRAATRAIGALVGCLLALGLARADPFTVQGILVDETAADATAARAAALAVGQRAGWAALMRRLVAPEDAASLATLEDSTVAPLVQSFQVESEKVAPDRYVASLTYRFDGAGVRRLLESSAVAHVVTESPPVLVLPVLETGGSYLLFELENDWREAWQALGPVQGLVPVVVPFGDLADLAAIDAAQAVATEPGPMAAIATRYDSANVAVAVAALQGPVGALPTGLDVTLTIRRGGRTDVAKTSYAPPSEAGEDVVGELYRLAITGTIQALEDAWRQENLVDAGSEATLGVEVPVSGLDGWLDIGRRLARVGLVRGTTVKVMGVRALSVELRYLGDRTRLTAALADIGLALEEDAGLVILRAVDAAPAGTTIEPEPEAGTLVIE